MLRDGASAQYGSDAIAGVLNFILKDYDEGATFEARYGQTTENDGDMFRVSGNIGLPFTASGFANLSFEYGETDPTVRSIQRNDAQALIDESKYPYDGDGGTGQLFGVNVARPCPRLR